MSFVIAFINTEKTAQKVVASTIVNQNFNTKLKHFTKHKNKIACNGKN